MTVIHKIAYTAAMALMLTACGGEQNSSQYKEARRLGTEAAARLINEAPAMSVLQFESYLLQVRATQRQIRIQADSCAAEAYVSAFEHHIRQNSDSISNILFNTPQDAL